ncbi:MAG: AarF/ABC1/UbiB kinase family protein [Acidimicrobiia bacterium]|nr:AarF/ABC1/UbiB kinase family protein [Acidimicrobiia bacterium]
MKMKRAVLFGGAAVLGWILARHRRGAGHDTTSGAPVHQTGRAARNARMAGMGAKVGTSYAVHRARRAFAPEPRRAELDLEHQMHTAEQVAQTLGNMKGAMMKVGQMLSYLDEGLPEPLRDALAQLQQDAPPMSGELAAGVVERELGSPPQRLFAEWDPVPIAAASIGQVHRAITREGQAVAVKIQYPGVDEAITSDLNSAGMLFAGMRTMFPGLETGPVLDEIRSRLTEEVDYRKEAESQRFFADAYDGHPFIHIPAVVDEYCTGRVFTSELADGVRFDEAEQWSQEERDLAAETIYRFAIGSMWRLHVFNGDPHPGNYLFRPGGRVTFLDFGLVKFLTSEEVYPLQRLIETIVIDPDPAAFRQTLEDVGFLHHDSALTDDEVVGYFRHFYQFALDEESGVLDEKYASLTARKLFQLDGAGSPGIQRSGNVPPAYVILQRINLGLYAVLGQLRARAPWRAISEELWPWVDAPPATELGKQHAAWLAGRRAPAAD